jgi:hypothetical protein
MCNSKMKRNMNRKFLNIINLAKAGRIVLVALLLTTAACSEKEPVKADYDAVANASAIPSGVTTGDVVGTYGASAVLSVTVNSDGGSPLIAVGVIVNTSPDFTRETEGTIEGAAKTAATGTPVEVEVKGLTVDETYYYKAYALNANGVVYGTVRDFVALEDYAPAAEGEMYDDFWSGDTWNLTLEYSPTLDRYRLKDFMWEYAYPGYDLIFTWDKATGVLAAVGERHATYGIAVPTGIEYGSYGAITAYFPDGSITYDADSKTIVFMASWRVSAGGFGAYGLYYTITDEY